MAPFSGNSTRRRIARGLGSFGGAALFGCRGPTNEGKRAGNSLENAVITATRSGTAVAIGRVYTHGCREVQETRSREREIRREKCREAGQWECLLSKATPPFRCTPSPDFATTRAPKRGSSLLLRERRRPTAEKQRGGVTRRRRAGRWDGCRREICRRRRRRVG